MKELQLAPTHREAMAAAVFGGPRVTPMLLRQMLARHQLACPLCVVAMRQPGLPVKLKGAGALRLHEGLTYLLAPPPARTLARQLDQAHALHGSIETITAPGQLVGAIQQSILTLRQKELDQLDQPPPATDPAPSTSSSAHDESAPASPRARPGRPSLQAEVETRSLLVHHLQRHDPAWKAAGDLWMRLILRRHHRHLHEVRRKIIELLGQLTSPMDDHPLLGYAFAQGIHRIHRTHAFGDFPAALRQTLDELAPHLVGLTSQTPVDVADAPIARAMAYLRDHFHEPISLRDAAEDAGVSAPHLARLFKARTGQTVTQWLWRLRITSARQKLAETHDGVLDIALACGFESVEHFHRVFKRQVGQTPQGYRRRHAR